MQQVAFKARVSAGSLSKLARAASILVWEVRAHLTAEGLHVRAVNPENVAMVVVDIPRSAFESYEGSVTVGLDLDRLKKAVRAFSDRETVEVEIGDTLTLRNGRLSYTIPLIDPEAIRKDPKPPNLELPATVELSVEEFRRIINLADKVSNTVQLIADGEAFCVKAEGDYESITATYTSDKLVSYNGGKASSLFSVEYLKSFCSVAKSKDLMKIHLGNDCPAKFVFDLDVDGGGCRVEYILAPMVEERR